MDINNYDLIADLYDIYVPATFDFDFFVEECKKARGEVLELMSGTGRVSIPLLQAGVRLTCVDISGESNAILEGKLRELVLQAEVHTMDVCQLELHKQFAMVIIPFSSFAHLTTPAEQREALGRIARHLLPGGTFICTLGNPKLRQQGIDGQLRLFRKYALAEEGTLLLWIRESLSPQDPQVVEAMQFYEEYDGRGVMKMKRLLELHFRLTERDELEALAREAGFRVGAFYGGYDRAAFDEDSSPMMIWVLEKAAG